MSGKYRSRIMEAALSRKHEFFLERDSGRGFLDLFSTFCPPDRPKLGREKPILLSHPQVRVVMDLNGPCPPGRDPAIWDLIRGDIDCTRSDFLCHMLIHTLADTLGMELEQHQPRKGGPGRRLRRSWTSQLPSSGEYKKEALAAQKARWNAAAWHCTSCGRSEADLPQSTSFAFCVPCRGINLYFPYCNKDCQRRDWKLGDQPHKAICGKPVQHVPVPSPGTSVPLLTFDHASRSSQKDRHASPLPDPGFIRSSDLVSQIAYLSPRHNSPKDILYIFMRTTDTAMLCRALGTWEEIYFRTFRDHAFRNGDSKVVAVMYKFLSPQVPRGVFPLHLILAQLCREYNIAPVTLIELAKDIPVRELSKQDLDKFLVEMDSIVTLD